MQIETSWILLLLVTARIGTFFVTMPILSMKQFPAMTKTAIILALSFMVTQWLPDPGIEVTHLLSLALLVMREAVLGLVLGWITNMMFLAIQSAGDLIDFFAGLKMATSYDPVSGASGSIYSNLYNWIGALLFLIMNGHHYLIRGIVNSCFFLPIGDSKWFQFDLNGIVNIMTQSFLLGIQLALPMCLILFLVDIVLGLINRSVQQINVFVLGMPIKLLVSFVLTMILFSGLTRSILWALDLVVQILDYAMRSVLV